MAPALLQGSGFRVQGPGSVGFRVHGSGRRVQCPGCRVQGSGFESFRSRVTFAPALLQDSRSRAQGSGFRIQGPGSMVQGAGCRLQGPGSKVQDSAVSGSGSPSPQHCLTIQGLGVFGVVGFGFRVTPSQHTSLQLTTVHQGTQLNTNAPAAVKIWHT